MPRRRTATDIGQRTTFGAASGITGPWSGGTSVDRHRAELITIEFATIRGCTPAARTVSPNNQAIRPSLSTPLAPMSPAIQYGDVAPPTSLFSATAEVFACSGRRAAAGHPGSSCPTPLL